MTNAQPRSRPHWGILATLTILLATPLAAALTYNVISDAIDSKPSSSTLNVVSTTGKVGSYAGSFNNSSFAYFPTGDWWQFAMANSTRTTTLAWVKLDTITGARQPIVSAKTATCSPASDCVWEMRINETGRPQLEWYPKNNAGGVQITGPTALIVGVWYSIAATYDASDGTAPARLYVNGSQVNSGGSTGSPFGLRGSVNTNNSVGYSAANHCVCSIDQLSIYNRTLGAPELSAFHTGTQPATTLEIARYAFEGNFSAPVVSPPVIVRRFANGSNQDSTHNVTWIFPDDSTTMSVYANTSPTNVCVSQNFLGNFTVTSKDFTLPTNGATWWFGLIASGGGGGSSACSTSNGVFNGRPNMSASSMPGGVNLAWTQNGSATGLRGNTSSPAIWGVWSNPTNASVTLLADLNASAGWTFRGAFLCCSADISEPDSLFYRIQSVNASDWGFTSLGAGSAPGLPSNTTLTGTFTPCRTESLNWTQSTGASSYVVRRNSSLGLNTSWNVPPWGDFSTRTFNDTFPLANTTFFYTVAGINSAGEGNQSNSVNVTPSAVMTLGDCGLQWGGLGESDFAEQSQLSVDSSKTMLGIILVLLGTAIGFTAMGSIGGTIGGAVAGSAASVALGYLPPWILFLVGILILAGFVVSQRGSQAAGSLLTRERRRFGGR